MLCCRGTGCRTERGITGRVCSVSALCVQPGAPGDGERGLGAARRRGEALARGQRAGGKGHTATNHSPNPARMACTQPGLRIRGGTLQLPLASLYPRPSSCIPAMLRGPSPILPTREMPMPHQRGQSSPATRTEDWQRFQQRMAAGRGGQPWAPGCPSRQAGGFPSAFRALASSPFISGRTGSHRPRWARHHRLGVLPSRRAVRAGLS